MAHSNISIFVPHVGCPHMCAFCNQRTITGTEIIPHAEDVIRICTQAMGQVTDISDTEIAFFGGSFTAVPREYMLELLNAASKFVGKGKFKGIRLSTRPDYIDDEVLSVLKQYGVSSIELGAQSLSDKVLLANERGHSSDDVIVSSKLIKSYGFELGLQMMVGLYESTPQDEIATMKKIIEIAPDTVRVYPVAVLKNTRLAKLYECGDYSLMSFEQVVDLCCEMTRQFHKAGIEIIRMGLHSSETVKENIVAGYFHPAFNDIVLSRLFLNSMEYYIEEHNINKLEIKVNPRSVSCAVGQHKSNRYELENRGITAVFSTDKNIDRYEIKINEDTLNVFEITGNTRL